MRSISVLLLSFVPLTLAAQMSSTPVLVDRQVAQQHQLMHIDPVYPPIARAAHVTGDVKIQLGIDTNGQVTSTTLLSGPPMLVGAAMDSVHKWTYTPFLQDGKPIAVTTVVTVSFSVKLLPGDEKGDKVADKYFSAAHECRDAAAKKDTAKTATACRHAADIAETFPPDVRFIERRSAYVTAATADLQNHQYSEALDYARKAVSVVELGHDDGSGACGAYATLAEAESVNNNLAGADRDFTKAEDAERGAIATIQSDQLKLAYNRTLKAVLSLHAQVLAAMGNTNLAQAKQNEAAKL